LRKKNYSNIKFYENPSTRNLVVPCEQTDLWTDMTMIKFVFRNSTNAPMKCCEKYPEKHEIKIFVLNTLSANLWILNTTEITFMLSCRNCTCNRSDSERITERIRNVHINWMEFKAADGWYCWESERCGQSAGHQNTSSSLTMHLRRTWRSIH